MYLLEKVESALNSTRISALGTSISESDAATLVKGKKDAVFKQVGALKTRVVGAMPFASKNEFEKLDKKLSQVNRKLTQLKKQFKDLEN